jgi:hypothetical protein
MGLFDNGNAIVFFLYKHYIIGGTKPGSPTNSILNNVFPLCVHSHCFLNSTSTNLNAHSHYPLQHYWASLNDCSGCKLLLYIYLALLKGDSQCHSANSK